MKTKQWTVGLAATLAIGLTACGGADPLPQEVNDKSSPARNPTAVTVALQKMFAEDEKTQLAIEVAEAKAAANASAVIAIGDEPEEE